MYSDHLVNDTTYIDLTFKVLKLHTGIFNGLELSYPGQYGSLHIDKRHASTVPTLLKKLHVRCMLAYV